MYAYIPQINLMTIYKFTLLIGVVYREMVV